MKYLQELKNSLLNPSKFFSKLKTRSLADSIKFGVMIYCLSWLVEYINSLVILHQPIPPFVVILWILTSLPVIIFLILPLVLTIHFLSRLLGGQASLTSSLKGSLYSSAPTILISVPYLNVVVLLYQLYLLTLALKHIHQLSLSKALLVILIPAIAITLMAILLGLISG